LQEITRDYTDYHDYEIATMNHKRLLEITREYHKIQEITRDYHELQEITRDY